MRRILFIATLVLMGVAAGALWWATVRAEEALADVPAGDQEVAWIHTATSVSAWERFVTGVNRVSRDWPDLSVDDSQAFPEQTTATPELLLKVAGAAGRIRIRWYKLTQNTTAATWSERLANRVPPPLAVIGGGSSDRAIDLARALAAQKEWRGEPPLLFFMTATATEIFDPDSAVPFDLMQVYGERSFRMCFTNEQMANAIVDFVWSQPNLRPQADILVAPIFVMDPINGMEPTNAAARLVAQDDLFPPSVYTLQWADDPYSMDLEWQFRRALHELNRGVVVRLTQRIPFSIGGNYTPNDLEREAVQRLLNGITASPLERQLLVLPTSAAPARRVLRSICGALPMVGRNLVAVTGDSINLNDVFRDHDVAWNARTVPVPLVFFAHQDPVGWDWAPPEENIFWPADRAPKPAPPLNDDPEKWPADVLAPPTSTDEILLHRDLVRLIGQAAYGVGDAAMPLRLTSSSNELRQRLRSLDPPVFDAVGNRQGGRGEYVLWLDPQFNIMGQGATNQVLPIVTLDVWTRKGEPPQWRPVIRLTLDHGRSTHARN